jgi:hypothetical protein
LRKLRLAAPAQLSLGIPGMATTSLERWWSLPTEVQEAVVCVLARMIAGGVVVEDKEVEVDDFHS